MNAKRHDQGAFEPVFTAGTRSRGPRWSTVVGCISLCVAVAVGGLLVHFGLRDPNAPEEYRRGAGFGLAVMLLLFVAGGLLILRRPVARVLHVVWAWIVLIMVIADFVLATATGQRPPVSFLLGAIAMAFWPVFLIYWFKRPAIRDEIDHWE